MPLNMQALSEKFGVAITGVDLSKELDQNLLDEIVDVFVRKQVVVFRDQHIEPQHQGVCIAGITLVDPQISAWRFAKAGASRRACRRDAILADHVVTDRFERDTVELFAPFNIADDDADMGDHWHSFLATIRIRI